MPYIYRRWSRSRGPKCRSGGGGGGGGGGGSYGGGGGERGGGKGVCGLFFIFWEAKTLGVFGGFFFLSLLNMLGFFVFFSPADKYCIGVRLDWIIHQHGYWHPRRVGGGSECGLLALDWGAKSYNAGTLKTCVPRFRHKLKSL